MWLAINCLISVSCLRGMRMYELVRVGSGKAREEDDAEESQAGGDLDIFAASRTDQVVCKASDSRVSDARAASVVLCDLAT